MSTCVQCGDSDCDVSMCGHSEHSQTTCINCCNETHYECLDCEEFYLAEEVVCDQFQHCIHCCYCDDDEAENSLSE